jgi:hypothetical protein
MVEACGLSCVFSIAVHQDEFVRLRLEKIRNGDERGSLPFPALSTHGQYEIRFHFFTQGQLSGMMLVDFGEHLIPAHTRLEFLAASLGSLLAF